MRRGKGWKDFWGKAHFDAETDKRITKDELSSVRWKKIKNKTLNTFGSFKGLKVVEIGCGRGENALLMTQLGAEVTLIDNNAESLEKAAIFFKNMNCKAHFAKYDVFNIPSEFLNKFDVSMSFGLAEHFYYRNRPAIFEIHLSLIRVGGISFISVPNAWCFPYRIYKALAQFLNYWKTGLEIPFSYKELRKLAKVLKFRSYEIFGSSIIKDMYYFGIVRLVERITNHRIRLRTDLLEIPTILDDYFGYALILCGEK